MNKLPDKEIEFRLATAEDVVAISQLRNLFINAPNEIRRSCSPDYYLWKIFKNPIKTGLAYLAMVDNKVVGMVSVSARPVLVRGNSIMMAELGDGFVHPNYQRRGIFVKLLNLILKDADNSGFEYIYGTPTPQAFSVEKKVGFRIQGNVKLHMYLRPIALSNILNKYSTNKIVEIFGNIGQFILNLLSAGRIHSKVKTTTRISTYSEFITRCHENGKHEIRAKINKAYLEWRYDSNPDEYKLCMVEHPVLGNGYVILKIGYSRGFKVGYIADYGYDGKSKFLREILKVIIREMGEQNIDMIATWSGTLKNDFVSLISFGFFPVSSPLVISRKNKNSELEIQDMTWRFCLADSDNI